MKVVYVFIYVVNNKLVYNKFFLVAFGKCRGSWTDKSATYAHAPPNEKRIRFKTFFFWPKTSMRVQKVISF